MALLFIQHGVQGARQYNVRAVGLTATLVAVCRTLSVTGTHLARVETTLFLHHIARYWVILHPSLVPILSRPLG